MPLLEAILSNFVLFSFHAVRILLSLMMNKDDE